MKESSRTRPLQAAGLLLFVVGFLAYNLSAFLGDYRLTRDIVARSVQDSTQRALFLQHAASMLDRTYGTSYEFVRTLDDAFESANRAQLERYRISPADIDAIVEKSAGKFATPVVDSVFRVSNQVTALKSRLLREHASGLEDEAFDDATALRGRLQQIAGTINQYYLLQQIGFDRYAVKELKYQLTKASSIGPVTQQPALALLLTMGIAIAGAMMYILPKQREHKGIKNNGVHFNPMKNRGWLGILTGTWLILFYVALYFYPEYMTNWMIMVDPISRLINGHEAGKFFLYGLLYTLAILVMGVRFMMHYRHSRYHLIRTVSVMFFQLGFAFLIPEILVRLKKPYYDFKNIWPLDYTFFFDYRLDEMIQEGTLGIFMIGWGLALIVLAVPLMTFFYGKRWYCSWVCGCGGLAETLGDPYRHLSQKSLRAWKIERWMVHGVLVFAVVMTAGVLYTWFTQSAGILFIDTYTLRDVYGIYIGAIFAGVVGTGFYPFMGNRVWCRYGCPLAAYIGLVQRFKSRFRITTNGGQCISCGNCSTYCEMGIDVRWYAQRGQNVIRASCVGCGICASVCPRGVLKLEVKGEKGRFGTPELTGNNHFHTTDR